jgi:acetyl esterase/lipase
MNQLPRPLSPGETRCKRSLSHLSRWVITRICLFLFVWFALTISPSSQAQTPPPTTSCTPTPLGITSPTPTPDCTLTPSPTPSPTPTALACETAPAPTATQFPTNKTPTATPIPSLFQQPNGAILTWRIYTPVPSPTVSPPAVIVIHGGGFRAGSAFDGDGMLQACADLAANGFYVVSVNYELAPCGLIPGQPLHTDNASGRPPNQSNDIKAFVKALRADFTHHNGKIGVVGGSAGGTHAVWVALDNTTSGNQWPYWNCCAPPCETCGTVDDRVDCAVSLSGAYGFDDRTPESYVGGVVQKFVELVVRYTNTGNPDELRGFSPVSLVRPPTQNKPFKPLFLINSINDQGMPYHQIVDMICTLRRKGVQDTAYQTLTVSGNQHEFQYWCQDAGMGDGETVGQKVIKFLHEQLGY